MAETSIEIQAPNQKELAQRNYDYALEVALNGVTNPVDEPEHFRFMPFVNYRPDANEKERQAADLAIKDLFKAAAERERVATLEEKQKTGPYTNKALALEKPGPYEIAYDFVLGNRTKDEAKQIASGVWAEFMKDAENRRHEFRIMKQTHLRKSKIPTRDPQWSELTWLSEGQYHQAERANEFMQQNYKIEPFKFEHTEVVEKLKQTRSNPLPEQNLKTQLGF